MKKLTRKPSHGSVKTKNPTSRPNCGSLVPNGTALRHSRNVRQAPMAAAPARRPRTEGMTTVARRRSGSRTWRYWSRTWADGEGAMRSGRVRYAVTRLAATAPAVRMKAAMKSKTRVPSWVMKTSRKPTESNHQRSVRIPDTSRARITSPARMASVVPSGPRLGGVPDGRGRADRQGQNHRPPDRQGEMAAPDRRARTSQAPCLRRRG